MYRNIGHNSKLEPGTSTLKKNTHTVKILVHYHMYVFMKSCKIKCFKAEHLLLCNFLAITFIDHQIKWFLYGTKAHNLLNILKKISTMCKTIKMYVVGKIKPLKKMDGNQPPHYLRIDCVVYKINFDKLKWDEIAQKLIKIS